MTTYTKEDIQLAAQLKAESANWVGYNSDIVEKVAGRLTHLALEVDSDRLDSFRSMCNWFAGILAVAIAVLGLGTSLWWSDFRENAYNKYREELKLELSKEYTPVKVESIFEKDGLLYIKKN